MAIARVPRVTAPYAPPAPPPAGARTDGYAIASLITGLLGGFPLGIGFGIAALMRIHRWPHPGRGPAIGGIIASGCWLVIFAAGAAFGALTVLHEDAVATPVAVTPRDRVTIDRLAPGDCVNEVEETLVFDVPVVPCDSPHEGEVYSIFELPEGPYPGDAAVERQADERCESDLDDYTGAGHDDLWFTYFYPDEEDWWDRRVITCITHNEDPVGDKLVGTVRG